MYFYTGNVDEMSNTIGDQQQEEANQIDRELRQFVDTANAPIFGIDVDGNVNEWNNKTAEITGFSKEEAWNKPLGNFLNLLITCLCMTRH